MIGHSHRVFLLEDGRGGVNTRNTIHRLIVEVGDALADARCGSGEFWARWTGCIAVGEDTRRLYVLESLPFAIRHWGFALPSTVNCAPVAQCFPVVDGADWHRCCPLIARASASHSPLPKGPLAAPTYNPAPDNISLPVLWRRVSHQKEKVRVLPKMSTADGMHGRIRVGAGRSSSMSSPPLAEDRARNDKSGCSVAQIPMPATPMRLARSRPAGSGDALDETSEGRATSVRFGKISPTWAPDAGRSQLPPRRGGNGEYFAQGFTARLCGGLSSVGATARRPQRHR